MQKQKWIILILTVFMAVSAFSQSNIGLNGVGGKLGYVDPEGEMESTFGFGAVADLGTITPKILLEADIFYWGKSYDESFLGSSTEVKFTSITLSAVAKYLFADAKEQMRPFAGAGLGFAMNKAKVEGSYTDYTGQTHSSSSSSSDNDIVIHLCGGVKYRLNPKVDGFAELRYTMGDGDILAILVGGIWSLQK